MVPLELEPAPRVDESRSPELRFHAVPLRRAPCRLRRSRAVCAALDRFPVVCAISGSLLCAKSYTAARDRCLSVRAPPRATACRPVVVAGSAAADRSRPIWIPRPRSRLTPGQTGVCRSTLEPHRVVLQRSPRGFQYHKNTLPRAKNPTDRSFSSCFKP
jgi:hypothetical protein